MIDRRVQIADGVRQRPVQVKNNRMIPLHIETFPLFGRRRLAAGSFAPKPAPRGVSDRCVWPLPFHQALRRQLVYRRTDLVQQLSVVRHAEKRAADMGLKFRVGSSSRSTSAPSSAIFRKISFARWPPDSSPIAPLISSRVNFTLPR